MRTMSGKTWRKGFSKQSEASMPVFIQSLHCEAFIALTSSLNIHTSIYCLLYFTINKENIRMKSTGFFAEFKKFISRGNVLDMAVGIAAGAAFTAIINSFVNDIINPIIGVLIGGVDFSELTIVLKHATETTPEVAIRYGMFINSIISFIIISFALFLMVKAFNRLAEAKKKEEEAAPAVPPAPPADIQLLTEIRDLLKKEN